MERFITWLKANTRPELHDPIDCDGLALASWLNDIDETGHIEIGSRYSITGNPIIGSFPELAQK